MNSIKILLTGGEGNLSGKLRTDLSEFEVFSPGKGELDVTNPVNVDSFFKKTAPDVVVHTAAITDVDYCQSHPLEAEKVNVSGTENICLHSKNIRLIYLSTDYIFDGKKKRPYREDDGPNPLSVYGKTKLDAENAVLSLTSDHMVVRTSWLLSRTSGFLMKIANLLLTGKKIPVVDDTVGSPTVVDFLSLTISQTIGSSYRGILNVANSKPATWFEVAKEYLELTGRDIDIIVRSSSENFKNKSPRPKYSVLDCSLLTSLTGIEPPSWRDSLKKHLEIN
ncbi:dTDP-4-dehydrorhamnose reductase [candidate division WOR-3 bacterium]|nr:dTDP-4-dehydrorhamnose reductase [candidate division WOR-3 bacterium]